MPQKKAFCNTLSVIRDTQMEQYAVKGVKKLFKSAGLNDNAVQVVFINDLSLNAFVAGGSIVYIYSGLIIETDYCDEFFGVLAHETGHVVGGHTIRLASEMGKAQTTALITTILGGIAAVASGRGDVGMAIMLGGMSSATGMLNAYRQSEENSADSIAVDLIRKSDYSVQGLYNVMKKIEKEERLRVDNVPTYLRSHPLTRDRLAFMQNAAEQAKPMKDDPEYLMIKAKLFAFLKSPEETRIIYNDDSLPAIYANAIADFKQTKITEALQKTDRLIAQQPANPYFYELKGQILFESGQIEKSVQAYQKAFELLPQASLIRLSLAQALLETGEAENRKKAIDHLLYITARDKYLPDAWYFLHIAYAQNNNFDLANYAKIEYLMLAGKTNEVKKLLPKTQKALQSDTVKSNRLADIEDQINDNS